MHGMCVHREVSYQTLLRQNTYVSPSAQPVQNRTNGRSKRSRMTVKKNLDLTVDQIKGIYTGELTTWSDVQ